MSLPQRNATYWLLLYYCRFLLCLSIGLLSQSNRCERERMGAGMDIIKTGAQVAIMDPAFINRQVIEERVYNALSSAQVRKVHPINNRFSVTRYDLRPNQPDEEAKQHLTSVFFQQRLVW